jgi:hypothetical protein
MKKVIILFLVFLGTLGNAPLFAQDTQTNSNDPLHTLSSGIYYFESQTEQYIEIDANMFSQSKQGSGILTSMTYGLAKTKQKAVLSGTKANLLIKTNAPSFYFVFDKEKSSLNETSQTATSPNQFVLVKFNITTNKKSRELVTGSYNAYEGMASGIDEAQKITFKYEKMAQGIYRVYIEQTLQKGEYGFICTVGATTGSAPMQKVFDFGIEN